MGDHKIDRKYSNCQAMQYRENGQPRGGGREEGEMRHQPVREIPDGVNRSVCYDMSQR